MSSLAGAQCIPHTTITRSLNHRMCAWYERRVFAMHDIPCHPSLDCDGCCPNMQDPPEDFHNCIIIIIIGIIHCKEGPQGRSRLCERCFSQAEMPLFIMLQTPTEGTHFFDSGTHTTYNSPPLCHPMPLYHICGTEALTGSASHPTDGPENRCDQCIHLIGVAPFFCHSTAIESPHHVP